MYASMNHTKPWLGFPPFEHPNMAAEDKISQIREWHRGSDLTNWAAPIASPVFVQHDGAWLYHTVWNLKTTSLMWTTELLSRWLLAAEGSREAESKSCGAWWDWCIMEKNTSPVPWHHRGPAQLEEPDWNLSSGGNTVSGRSFLSVNSWRRIAWGGWSRSGANGSASRPEKAKNHCGVKS